MFYYFLFVFIFALQTLLRMFSRLWGQLPRSSCLLAGQVNQGQVRIGPKNAQYFFLSPFYFLPLLKMFTSCIAQLLYLRLRVTSLILNFILLKILMLILTIYLGPKAELSRNKRGKVLPEPKFNNLTPQYEIAM